MSATAWTTHVTRVLAPNAGPMTLDGTNTYVVRAPGSDAAVIVDPGPADAGHLRTLVGTGRIEAILLTHQHLDHVEVAPELHRATGAPVRAALPELCIEGAPLVDGEIVRAGGCEIEILATPGHSEDSISLRIAADAPIAEPDGAASPIPAASSSAANGVILTGDTILGRGTTVLLGGPTALRDYLDSLERLAAYGDAVVLPGHGDPIASVRAAAEALIAHRRDRLDQIRSVLAEHALTPADPRAADIVMDRLYADVPAGVRRPAALSVRSQLDYLIDAADEHPVAGELP